MNLTNQVEKLIDVHRGAGRLGLLACDETLPYFLEEMRELLGATRAVWLLVVRNKDFVNLPACEMLYDWYVLEMARAEAEGHESAGDSYERYMKAQEQNLGDPDVGLVNALKGEGRSRAMRIRNVIGNAAWEGHWNFRDFYQTLGTGDLMHTVVSVDEDCESWVLLHRGLGQPFFSEEDEAMALAAMLGMRQMHVNLARLRGAAAPCRRMLSLREREVLLHLLEGLREKEIAAELEISTETAHKHLASIYRKFEVGGKFDLLRRFL